MPRRAPSLFRSILAGYAWVTVLLAAGVSILVYTSFRSAFRERALEDLTRQQLEGFAINQADNLGRILSQDNSVGWASKEQKAWLDENLPAGIIAGFEFIGVEDSHQTDICSSLSGRYFAWDLASEILPPLHPGCRSFQSPISAEEAAADGIIFEESV